MTAPFKIMATVKLIESVRRIKNQAEVIATVQDDEGEFLGVSNFFLASTDLLPDDEDELVDYLNDKELYWEEYVLDLVD
jgi:hypothetical protein